MERKRGKVKGRKRKGNRGLSVSTAKILVYFLRLNAACSNCMFRTSHFVLGTGEKKKENRAREKKEKKKRGGTGQTFLIRSYSILGKPSLGVDK